MKYYKRVTEGDKTHIFYVDGSRLEYLFDRVIGLYNRKEHLNSEYYKETLFNYWAEINNILEEEVTDYA